MADVSDPGAGEGAACDPSAWVVLVADPVTGETDAFGPFGRAAAQADAARRRAEHAAEGLDEVLVVTVPLTPPGD